MQIVPTNLRGGRMANLEECTLLIKFQEPVTKEELEGDIYPDAPREVEERGKDKKEEPKPSVVQDRKQDEVFRQPRMGIFENIIVQKEVQEDDNPPYSHELYLGSIKLQSKERNKVGRDKKREQSPHKNNHKKFEIHDPFER